MDIAQNVKTVFERIEAAAIKAGRQPEDISLVAATKTNGRQAIAAALAASTAAVAQQAPGDGES